MALGATIKVAMDTSAVRRGLSKIKASFTRLGSVLRGIGGAMRKSLIPVVGILAGIGAAAKSAVSFGSDLRGISQQTGLAAEKILELREAFRLANIDIDDSADVLSDFQERLEDARAGGGTAGEGLAKLNLSLHDLLNMDIGSAFAAVMRAVRESNLSVSEMAFALDKLFGESGFKLVRLARDYDAIMAKAAKNTEELAKVYNDDFLEKLDQTRVAMGRLRDLFRSIFGRIAAALPLETIANALDKALSPDKLKPIVDFITKLLSDPLGALGDLWEKIKELGTMIGEGIVEVIENAAEGIGKKISAGLADGFGLLGGLMGGGKKDGSWWDVIRPKEQFPQNTMNTKRLESHMTEELRILRNIERKEGASFA
tara:strand:- start:2368 stop:3480 length:1113 start_codon:yes stop_codon:yes gene_type:complete